MPDPELPDESGMFTTGYWLIPVARFVEEFGTNDWETLMRLCEEITKRHTSEGARPRLPWAKRHDGFVCDPEPILTLVEPLRADASPYVRKSVADLLNDVSKDHSNRVMSLCIRRSAEGDERTQWIVRHGLGSLTKTNSDAAIAICSGKLRVGQPEERGVQRRTPCAKVSIAKWS